MLLLLILGLVLAGKMITTSNWLAALSNILLLPFLFGSWDLLASRPLRKADTTHFGALLGTFREKQKVRQIIWIVLFAVGTCLAVFTSLGKWDPIYVIIGLGLAGPAGLFYLAALGLGLQSDWLLHSLDRET